MLSRVCRRVVSVVEIELIDPYCGSRFDFNSIVPGTGVNPHRLLNRWADGDLVVARQRVDEDDLEIAFRW